MVVRAIESDAVDLIIEPETKDLGEFTVHRTLPAESRQRVGPFIFFDHFGPAEFAPGHGVDVRAHPHIGIATITYLFEGQILHRDSLGFAQVIEPAAVNWMTAGRGIVHSERTPPDLVESGSRIHGLQTWVALPLELEECEPSFDHYPADRIPGAELPGAALRIVIGEAFGEQSPVLTASGTLYVECKLKEGASLELPVNYDEAAVYAIDGDIAVDGTPIANGTMAVLNPGAQPRLSAATETLCMILGGAALEGERILWWNFVSSSRGRLQQARRDWREKRFDDVPGETEFIPLPES